MRASYKVGDKTFKQHLDGYNFLPFFQGKDQKSPRHEIFYFDQGGNLNAVRYDDWKVNFAITEGAINTAYRKTPAWPVIINLRADPFESAPHDSGLFSGLEQHICTRIGERTGAYVPRVAVMLRGAAASQCEPLTMLGIMLRFLPSDAT